MLVTQLKTANGTPATDQFLVNLKNATVFQSNGLIAAINTRGKLYVNVEFWNEGQDTVKYLKRALAMDKTDEELKKYFEESENIVMTTNADMTNYALKVQSTEEYPTREY